MTRIGPALYKANPNFQPNVISLSFTDWKHKPVKTKNSAFTVSELINKSDFLSLRFLCMYRLQQHLPLAHSDQMVVYLLLMYRHRC